MNMFPLGGILSLVIFLPNLIAVMLPPGITTSGKSTPPVKLIKIMTIVERTGQIGCFSIPFFYHLRFEYAKDALIIILMAALLSFYYAGWIRYLARGRSRHLFYKSMLGMPLPMSIAPVLYFLMASVLLASMWLFLSVILLGIGHITIGMLEYKNISDMPASG